MISSRVIFLALVVISAHGCLRYTPSRSELASNAPVEQPSNLGGQEEFYAFERRLDQRLEEFVQSRSSLLQAAALYKVGPGDLIEFSVFGLPELDSTMRVSPEGTISLELIGEVQAEGKTESELRDHLASKLTPFVRNPRVKLFIAEYQAHRISVIGEVAKPGAYALRHQRYHLLDLLSESGGRTEKASGRLMLVPDQGRVQLPSQSALEPDPVSINAGIEIDLDDLYGSPTRAPVTIPLLAGDTIVVPEAGAFEVDGEVVKPGSYPLAAKTSLLGAIAAAGGLTYSAKIDEVEVVRDVGSGKKAAITLDLEKFVIDGGDDIRLRNGDIVRVPSEGGKFVQRQIVEFINGLVNVGVRPN